MQLEFHQLDRRWEHLRVHHPARQRRLLASLADSGQQTPIVVVAAEGQQDRYVVIDGYKRIAAPCSGNPVLITAFDLAVAPPTRARLFKPSGFDFDAFDVHDARAFFQF